MLRKTFIAFVTFLLSLFAVAAMAQDSSRLRISLLTVTPGEELYSTFGHSAFRLIDSNAVVDIVYNYGTFNFDDPDFYEKFIRGKLMYYVSTEYYSDFEFSNKMENRGITEQVLDLSPEEKIQLRDALNQNILDENKFYLYDFFLDNCTTRLRDLVKRFHQPQPVLPAVMPLSTTFRNAIHLYLDKNKKDWSKLGIDLLLGAPTDAIMTVEQQEFLPDNLMIALDNVKNVPVVKEKINAFVPLKKEAEKDFFTPTTCAILLLLFFVVLHLLSLRSWFFQVSLTVMDGLLFFITGAIGCLLVFMWWGTDHIMTKQNYNLLWALPFHLIAGLFIYSQKKWVKSYFTVTAILMLLLLVLWLFLPQEMNNAFLPLVILLMYRAAFISRSKEKFNRHERFTAKKF